MTIGDAVPPRSACLSLLRYIYYDDVSMPPQDALYLFSASHYFQFSNLRLHVFCKQNLEANVSKNNVFDVNLTFHELFFTLKLIFRFYFLIDTGSSRSNTRKRHERIRTKNCAKQLY